MPSSGPFSLWLTWNLSFHQISLAKDAEHLSCHHIPRGAWHEQFWAHNLLMNTTNPDRDRKLIVFANPEKWYGIHLSFMFSEFKIMKTQLLSSQAQNWEEN